MTNPDRHFMRLLEARWYEANTLVCVGLDPDIARLPKAYAGDPNGISRFCIDIIDATAASACAFKPQIAHFAAAGAEAQLETVISHIKEQHPQVPVILDAKRGDIGSTATHYAHEAFVRYGADAVTVSPYLGGDTLEPFLKDPSRGVFVLCRTSNPGSGDFQSLTVDGRPLFLEVAQRAEDKWNGNGNCGLVVGATWPRELGEVRHLARDLPILVPGIGAQGGDLEAVMKVGTNHRGGGLIINSSRAILYASEGDDFKTAAGQAAQALKDSINQFRLAQ